MKLTIDFESRSRADLKKLGPWNYWADPSSEALMLAVKADDKPPHIWVNPNWSHSGLPWLGDHDVCHLVEEADEIEAHNAEFERAGWYHYLQRRLGWPDLPFEKLRCSAARASMCNLPRSLGQACEVLGLPVQKDMEGKRIMLKFCKPQKKRRRVHDLPVDPSTIRLNDSKTSYTADKVPGPVGQWVETESWYEDPAAFVKLCQYCMQDVEAEYALSQALPPLPPQELAIWRLDQEINRRGIRVDVGAAKAMMAEIAKEESRLLKEFVDLTNGEVSSPKQVEAFLAYLAKEFNVDLADLRKSTVAEALEDSDE